MRILLDETLDWRLERALRGHVVRSLYRIGWSGMNDAEVLNLAHRAFDVFITMAGTLSGRQNLARYHLAVVALQAPSNRLADTEPLMARVLALLPALKPGEFVTVNGKGNGS